MSICDDCIKADVCITYLEEPDLTELPKFACLNAVKSRRGVWVPYNTIDGFTKRATCTNCGYVRKAGTGCSLDVDNLPKFCEGCGASMMKGGVNK